MPPSCSRSGRSPIRARATATCSIGSRTLAPAMTSPSCPSTFAAGTKRISATRKPWTRRACHASSPRARRSACLPSRIAHPELDENVTLEMTQHLIDTYRRAGGSAELEVFPGVGHAFANFPGEGAEHGHRPHEALHRPPAPRGCAWLSPPVPRGICGRPLPQRHVREEPDRRELRPRAAARTFSPRRPGERAGEAGIGVGAPRARAPGDRSRSRPPPPRTTRPAGRARRGAAAARSRAAPRRSRSASPARLRRRS